MESIKYFLRFVSPYKFKIFIAIVLGFVRNAIPMLLPIIMMYIVDNIIGNNEMVVDQKVYLLVVIMLGSFLIYTILRVPVEYYSTYVTQWIGNKILYDIRKNLFEHLQKLSLRFYHEKRSGEVVSRVVHDVEHTKHFVTTGLINLWLDIVAIIIAVAVMLKLNIQLTFVSLLILPFYAVAMRYFFSKFRDLSKQRSKALAEVHAHLSERIQGISVVKSFALEKHEEKVFDNQNTFFHNRALGVVSYEAKTQSIVNTITDIAPLLIIAFGGYQVILGNLTLGALLAFYVYAERIYNPLRRLINSTTHLTQSLAAMDRVVELMKEPYDLQEKADAVQVEKVVGNISFKDVSFQYGNKSESVLKDINIDIRQGETVALVGASGGGKSSFISLIPRFFDVYQGAITIDGIDVRDYSISCLRKQIGMVLQEPVLFSHSIRENIMMGNPKASEQEMIFAAKKALAHDFIENLPEGYDTEIGERGVKLSGGQRQRIAIARLFLKKPQIIILDEATSALDLETEKHVQHSINELSRDRTTIIVAHRLATITHADTIIVMDGGQIVEKGTHEQLMEQKGSYYQLFIIQNLDENSPESETIISKNVS
ncbi:ABC transporter ATP-binding protein [Desulfuribacillus alkaliarsenatis]|uniref:Multidrug ABC transporter ATP-binding protein n=1 Tax=Desulfuribacillus alkaliarsenatis TaxID=766136 RepID=A0A1E5G4U9_9FIRM|nr:ABC transporter ATP-binding protein [Desulfuribacillus alkaliarsenatis]OEF98125.1 multidrug ABC transporter ATP-binding protein [Desulfuribacillus alkaliarsenatis]